MRYIISFLCIFILVSIALFVYKNETTPHSYNNKFAEKHEPYDLFFLREYPDYKPALAVYENTLRKIKVTATNRTANSFDGTWQLQGPGNAGARINSIAVHPTDENIILAGFSSGGLWKTTDGGANWYPVFEDKEHLAISHISFNPDDPNVLYLGTGDRNITGYPFIGDGAYRSTDLGESWTHIGLTEQRIIAKIEAIPGNPDVLFAACMGLPFERNTERGLYKSTDGGQSWQQVLFLSDSAGIIDFQINPVNPNIMYASGWNRIRNNVESIATGTDARIFKTTDGGDNWTQLTNGLPDEPLGRINLAMSVTTPDKLYAIYVSEFHKVHGIYKSENGGANWTTQTLGDTNGLTNPLGNMGWYFSRIILNPENDNEIYLLGVRVWRSLNGGTSWSSYTTTSSITHADAHDLVFTVAGNKLLATDGGMYRQAANQSDWEDIENIPATQFYRVGYNPHLPEMYYGGTQDNGTLVGNSNNINTWETLFGLDGFKPVFNPDDPNIFYVETQRGNIWRTLNGGGSFSGLNSGIPSSDQKHWDMPYIMSHFNSDLLYAGASRVYRTYPEAGISWEVVSPQLTGPIVNSASFHTITTIDESQQDSLMLYAGTTDARVWRTLDGGTNWDNISAGLPERYVSSVRASPDFPEKVYVTQTGYKDNDNTALIHRSDDNGDTWTAIANNLPALAINDLLVLPGKADQELFVATDAGVYGSQNAGQSWERVGTNMPFIAVYHLVWNEAKNELVAATFGRSIQSYSLDSIPENPGSISIGGTLQTEAGAAVGGVVTTLVANNSTTNSPAEVGAYLYENLNAGDELSLTPEKDTSWSNGITTLDLVFIKRHILDVTELDSPYKIIAADVNKSNTITTFDLILLQRLILGIESTVESNQSWRFVRADYDFIDPLFPFDEAFPEHWEASDVTVDNLNVDFIAIKVGDVNLSADPLQ